MTSETCETMKCWVMRGVGAVSLLIATVVIGGTVVGWGIIGVTTLLGH